MTNNLSLTQVAASQSQKEVTINQQSGELDAAITEVLALDLTVLGSTVMTTSQFTRNIGIQLTHDTQAETLTIPSSIPRFFFVDNSAGTDILDVIKGVTTIEVVAGGVVSLLSDSTADGLSLVSSSAAMPFDIGGYQEGAPVVNDIILRYLFTRDVVFPINLTGSAGHIISSGTTDSIDLDIFQDTTDRGDISFAAAANTSTFTFAAPITFLATEYMVIDVSAIDTGATGSDILVTLKGTRDA